MNLCDIYIEKIIEVRTYDNEEYDNYLVKMIKPHKSEWGDKIEIVIEPEDAQEWKKK